MPLQWEFLGVHCANLCPRNLSVHYDPLRATTRKAREILLNNFEILLVVFTRNINTNHAIISLNLLESSLSSAQYLWQNLFK